MFVLKILQRIRQNLVTWMAEGIHKVPVGGWQKKPFDQLIFQWVSKAWLDMLRETILKCGIAMFVIELSILYFSLSGISLKLINSFLQNLLKIGVHIIHGCALYIGKYGI